MNWQYAFIASALLNVLLLFVCRRAFKDWELRLELRETKDGQETRTDTARQTDRGIPPL